MTQQNGLLEIEARLTQWAFYKINLLDGNIGWPSKNLTIALSEGCGSRFPPTSTCLISNYSNSQQIDSWVKAMGTQLPDLEDAISMYYTCKIPIGDLAKLIGISRRTLLTRVHDAKLWLCGRLNALIDAQEKEASTKNLPISKNW